MSTMTIHQTFDRTFRPARPARPGGVRLTRRGRLVVLTLAVLAILGIGVFVASGSVATGEAGAQAPMHVVTVTPGDTLWDIAADAATDGDVGAMVQQIEDLNALESGMVVVGQRLVVPAS
jgi:hypothetical protein